MKLTTVVLWAAFGVSSHAYAGLLGDTVSFAGASSGTTTFTLNSSGSAVVGNPSVEAFFCIGPNANNCLSSGFASEVNISNSAISFLFAGSNSGSTGGFTFTISGIDVPVISVTGGGSLQQGSFGLSSFTASSITFAGTAAGGFAAIGGQTLTFNVGQVPEPSTWALTGFGAVLLAWSARRRFHPAKMQ